MGENERVIVVNSAIAQTDSSWKGRLELIYRAREGQTQVHCAHAKAPLKVQRPFYPEGPQICHSVILHTAGGIVGGDRLSQSFHLEANTHALVTTAAAAKVYRTNGREAHQTINIQVDAGACLEWLPQESIIFNGAVYRQDLRVELAPGSRVLLWEINRFGRSARGEKFLQGQWRSHAEVWQEGRPLWIDRQMLEGGTAMVDGPHGLGGRAIAGTLAWIGEPVSRDRVEQIRRLWDGVPQMGTGEIGVTRLPQGVLCRYCGSSTPQVRNWFAQVWDSLRLSFLGRPSSVPRVWPLSSG